uniref:Uncharacterized protein n=1 Tax=Haemonchus contortus TaxID=6289 RepID=A0A7I4Y3C5_HAECO|nr:unnamed protein product [Haemonchus contortus]
MSKNVDPVKKSFEKKGNAERSKKDLRKIYMNAKRIYREEEAMLALCKTCMDSIKVRKEVVDRIRQETEAEMIASAGRLDEHIRRVTKVLDFITRMHITDSTEAAERLGKLADIDAVADEKIEDLRKTLELLEYQRREREPLLYRAYLFVCSMLNWIAIRMNQFMMNCRVIADMAWQKANAPSTSVTADTQQETSTQKSDETEVTMRQKREQLAAAKK